MSFYIFLIYFLYFSYKKYLYNYKDTCLAAAIFGAVCLFCW